MKRELKINSDIKSVHIAAKSADVLLFHHDEMFKEVLTKTAVTGIHHISHDQMFANAFQSTSLSLENGFLVLDSAIFHDIFVSKIVIIATTALILRMAYIASLFITSSFNDEKLGNIAKEKRKSGYLSTKSGIFGSIHLNARYQTTIHITDNIIAPGIFLIFFLARNKNHSHKANTQVLIRLISLIWRKRL